jgi:hypothetical protein
MTRTLTFRRVAAVVLMTLLAAVPAAADGGREQAPAGKSSIGKRIAWTVAGAGAGFAAGVFLGLNQFDDAVNSDRKVWTSALVGAGIGGVTAALLTRNLGKAPKPSAALAMPRREPARRVNVSWESALRPNANP